MKSLTLYLLGLFTTAAIVYFANTSTAILFLLSFLTGSAATAILFFHFRRRLLPVQITHTIHEVTPVVTRYQAQAQARVKVPVVMAKTERQEPLSQVGLDVVSALVNFGMRKKEAEKVVRERVGVGGGEGLQFEEAIRKCLV